MSPDLKIGREFAPIISKVLDVVAQGILEARRVGQNDWSLIASRIADAVLNAVTIDIVAGFT